MAENYEEVVRGWGYNMPEVREAFKNVLADFWGGDYPPIPLRKKSAKKQLYLAKNSIFGQKTPFLAFFDRFFKDIFC